MKFRKWTNDLKQFPSSAMEQVQSYGLPAWVFNKYVLVFCAFIAIVLFFDSFNVVERYQLSRELGQAKAQKAYYEREIVGIQDKLDELMVNKETLEKFAREEYYMKRKDEDVFVIVEE